MVNISVQNKTMYKLNSPQAHQKIKIQYVLDRYFLVLFENNSYIKKKTLLKLFTMNKLNHSIITTNMG